MAGVKRRTTLKPVDPNRLADMVRKPGLDTNTWVTLGRITEAVWDPDAGGMVAFTAVGGPLDGEEDLVASVAPTFAGPGRISSSPITVGAVGIFLVPAGDPNVDIQLIAWSLGPALAPPATVAGEDMADLFGTAVVLGAGDLPYVLELAELLAQVNGDVTAELDGDLEITAAAARVIADTVHLVKGDASQAFVRGNDFADALNAWLDATTTFATTVQAASTAASLVCVGPLAPLKAFFDALTPALVTWKTDVATLKAKLVPGQALSQKLFGE